MQKEYENNLQYRLIMLQYTKEVFMRKTISFIAQGPDDDYELACIQKAVSLNITISDVLEAIRGRLKYAEDVSEAEVAFLESLRSQLYEHYVEG